ncbi:HupE/UreJ family protein [Marivita hallyeonensis]|uniref:HupE / UreJ protein n=1 Tax=Marivita hallyeonensis TaxID=996342 RepID=A0A1M5QTJ8_9RHOB|nr:HupE/UreJ family protein [Marivita hallyeonensis]SHH17402.1 HupE / UreJ protein [Marivita hallyeonensis]
MKLLWAVIACLAWVTSVVAHEVRPAIADFEVTDGTLSLTITLNGEALAGEVSLDGITNTDELDASDDVDRLRALEPEALQAELQPKMPAFAESLDVTSGDTAVALQVTDVTVDEVGNTELPRDTVISLTGAIPSGAQSLSLTWPAAYGALVLRQQGVEEPYTGYLEGGQSSGEIALGGGDEASGWQTFATYIPVGFDHILPKGLDHILFVLGLFFLSTRFTPLLWQVTSFTLAHTVTLAMAVLGIVSVPGSIVEPLIAASIVYVAVENIVSDKLHRWRPFVIFGFGLLHGLGFASVLGEFGLPDGQVVPALIGFNIGVELGQLTVIAIAFILVWYALRVDRGEADVRPAQVLYGVLAVVFTGLGIAMNTDGFQEVMGASAMVFFWPLAALSVLCAVSATLVDQLEAYRRYVAIPASASIALVGAYWFVERVFL